jgi:hypothetical protein
LGLLRGDEKRSQAVKTVEEGPVPMGIDSSATPLAEQAVQIPLLARSARRARKKSAKVYYLGTSTAYIQRIEIKNYKAISRLRLEIPGPFQEEAPPQADQNVKSASTPVLMAPWKVLLGENGAGKSTVLQAVALALVGKPVVEQFKLRPGKILHRTQDGRALSGSIKVWLSDQPKPVEVRFNDSGFRFINRLPVQNLYVRGFGSTRLLPKDEDRQPPSDVHPQMDVENLFDPFDPLFDAEKWLPRLDPAHFDSVALAYKDILGLGGAAVKDVAEQRRVPIGAGAGDRHHRRGAGEADRFPQRARDHPDR